jgi:2-dehydro-3-deoxy-D-arabinonate dehydratase
VTSALYRVRLADGTHRIAWGSVEAGPRSLADPSASLDRVLSEHRGLDSIGRSDEQVPSDAVVVVPVEGQEVWAAGVTYLRSRDARREETVDPTPYDLVYEAERPELFFKAPGWRCVGPGDAIGIRRDSAWNVPEPEIALVLDADRRIVGATIGNDVSSRSIEGENPLYLPQAKVYDGACALGPCIVPIEDLPDALEIRMQVARRLGRRRWPDDDRADAAPVPGDRGLARPRAVVPGRSARADRDRRRPRAGVHLAGRRRRPHRGGRDRHPHEPRHRGRGRAAAWRRARSGLGSNV